MPAVWTMHGTNTHDEWMLLLSQLRACADCSFIRGLCLFVLHVLCDWRSLTPTTDLYLFGSHQLLPRDLANTNIGGTLPSTWLSQNLNFLWVTRSSAGCCLQQLYVQTNCYNLATTECVRDRSWSTYHLLIADCGTCMHALHLDWLAIISEQWALHNRWNNPTCMHPSGEKILEVLFFSDSAWCMHAWYEWINSTLNKLVQGNTDIAAQGSTTSYKDTQIMILISWSTWLITNMHAGKYTSPLS